MTRKGEIHNQRIREIFNKYKDISKIPDNLDSIDLELQKFEDNGYMYMYIPLDYKPHTPPNSLIDNDFVKIRNFFNNNNNLILITFKGIKFNFSWFLWFYDDINDKLILTNTTSIDDIEQHTLYQKKNLCFFFDLYSNAPNGTVIFLPTPLRKYINGEQLEENIHKKIYNIVGEVKKREDIIISQRDFSTEFKYLSLWFAFEKYAKNLCNSIEGKEIIKKYKKFDYTDAILKSVLQNSVLSNYDQFHNESYEYFIKILPMPKKIEWEKVISSKDENSIVEFINKIDDIKQKRCFFNSLSVNKDVFPFTIIPFMITGFDCVVLFKFVYEHINNKGLETSFFSFQKKFKSFEKMIFLNVGGALDLLRICGNLRHCSESFELSHKTMTVLINFFKENGVLDDSEFSFLNGATDPIASFYNYNYVIQKSSTWILNKTCDNDDSEDDGHCDGEEDDKRDDCVNIDDIIYYDDNNQPYVSHDDYCNHYDDFLHDDNGEPIDEDGIPIQSRNLDDDE